MSTDKPTDVQAVTSCLSRHHRLLEALRDGPKTKSKLADILDVSKPTVYYRFDQLQSHDIATRGTDGYRLTPLGHLVASAHLDAAARIECAYEIGPLLETMPPEAIPPPEALEGASCALCEGRPEGPSAEFREWILDASTVRGVLPHASRTFLERLCDAVECDETKMDVEIVLATETVEHLLETSPEVCRSVVESDVAVVLETPARPPYGLVLVEAPRPEFGLVAFTDHGHLLGFVRSASERGRRWAREEYEAYRAESNKRTTAQKMTQTYINE